jgi:beta-lactamase regulating signal transducer with metallopeptidase domain
VDALLFLAVSNAVMATLLAGVAAVVGWMCRRPVVRHTLWLLVLLKLVTPPLIPLHIAWPQDSDPLPAHAEPSSTAEPLAASSAAAEPVTGSPPLEHAPAPSVEAPSLPMPSVADLGVPAAMTVWLGVSLLWWSVAGLRLARFHRLLRQARPAPTVVQEQGARLARLLGLRRCPPIVFVPVPVSPLLWALGLAPRLLLPERLWQQLDAQQQDALLAHELAHLRRGDHWVRRLEFVVLGLYWWHPVVWWARRRLQEAEEECCDTRVVALLPDAASAYASALVETVTFLAHTRAAAPVGASGAGQVPLLKRRLTMILTATPPGRPSRAGFWVVLGLGALLLPMTPGAAQTDRPKPTAGSAAQRPADGDRLADLISFTRTEDSRVSDVHKHIMQSCMSCHVDPHQHARDFWRQSDGWRDKHDEAARLLGLLHESPRNTPAAANAPIDLDRLAREEKVEIEKLQDEIELLRVQVRLKEAHLRVAKRQQESLVRRYELVMKQFSQAPGSVTREAVMEAQLAAETAGDQVQIREAELQEPMVRLKQAERRLARLQPPAKSPAKSPRNPEQRLEELEKQLHQVLEDMKTLQGELNSRKPPSRSPAPGK